MATRGWFLAVWAISVFLGAWSATAECGAVETAERASYRALTLADFAGEQPREPGRPRSGGATLIVIVTAMAVDAVEVEVAPSPNGGWTARPASICLRSYLMKRESGRRRGAGAAWDLRHEQGHFDLTEVHARRLEDEIASLRAKGADADAAKRALRAEVARVYRAATAVLQADQDRYDHATRHGNHRSAQGRWTEAIAAALAPPERIVQAEP
jgi:hypothetical protein